MKSLIITLLSLTSFALASDIDYHVDIAPIFRDYCGGCHNESDFDGEFSIETFSAIMEGGESGKTIITPGDLEKSYLAELMLGKAKRPMPPSKEPQLSEEELERVVRWIEDGAQGPAPEDDISILANLSVPEIPARKGITKPITAAAYGPDGETLAVARFGEVQIGKLKISLDGKVNALHFSPDGRKVITASGITGLKGIAQVWDLTTGKEILSVGEDVHRDILFDAEFSPDGTLIATAGYDRTIRLWNATDGSLLRELKAHNGAVFDVAFSPDGSLVASASADETAKIWRVSDGERLDTLNQAESYFNRVAFTPDGRHIVGTGADKKIRLWELRSKDKAAINPVIHARFAHEDAVTEMVMSRDGRWLATASADETIKLWSLPDLVQVKLFGNQGDLVSALGFDPGNSLLAAARMNGETEKYRLGILNREGQALESYRPNTNPTSTQDASTAPMNFEETDAELLAVTVPAIIGGTIESEGDYDDYLFSAKAGGTCVLEIDAARSKSPLDSRIEILTETGEPIERVVLQATRDSWFTFRGKDSNTSDDFRVHNWREMELNEYLYANGEVVKLWHYPRGPDSGFRVYPGYGKRTTYFDTTAISHPLGGPCYIVAAFPPGSEPSPNGLPVYRLNWENDDDSERLLGSDSRLFFTAPADGKYRARVSDVRNFGGEDYRYKLTIRPPQPDFKVSHNRPKFRVSPGSGHEIEFTANWIDRFSGEIDIQFENMPAGFMAHPVTIEENQKRAYVAIYAAEDATNPTPEEVKSIRITATAMVGDERVTREVSAFTEFGLGSPAKLKVKVYPDSDHSSYGPDGILELNVRPGQTVSALVGADRIDHKTIVTFGKDDSGRNLPHGVYVDNIGLNGLMIPEGQSEQRFWITAAKWVPETERLFHLRTMQDGTQATLPVRVRVVR